MDRSEAMALLRQHLKNRNLIKHCIACEGAMDELAVYFDEDRHVWSLAGLLHDIDWDLVENDMDRHAAEGGRILEEAGLPDAVVHAVKAHNMKVPFQSRLDRALYAVDPLTGLIVACALMHPDKKLASLDLSFLQRRFQEKRFAAGADRDQIRSCESIGMSLDEFMAIVLRGMQRKSGELGL